ncbi:MAG: hypothetical protein JSW34_10640 [Candidatus Zixiibacteriota bacterium]|nr:MAG: hypothetical protein JSW34_10640 [candidate division Zixibacteria bacterium]
MSGIEIFQIWVMAFFTLALFSFLYKDNPAYKLAEHIFAGLTAGYQVGLIWDTIVIQKLWDPMIYGGKWWLFIPGILGFLMFARLFPKYSWLSRVSLAFVMGTTAGIFLFTQLHGLVLPQMQSTMLALGGEDGFAAALLAVVVVIGVISTLIYFYFSKEHAGVLGVTARVGIWFIMISFGAHFGYTVMGRVSLLIGRVQFLIEDWIGSFSQMF